MVQIQLCSEVLGVKTSAYQFWAGEIILPTTEVVHERCWDRGTVLLGVLHLWGVSVSVRTVSSLFFYIYFVYLFLAAPQDMWDLSSLARGQACAPCIGSVESQPLDSQGSPSLCFLKNKIPSQFRTHGDVVSLVLRQPEKSLCY